MSDNEIMSYEQVLEQEGRLVALNKGKSMMPLLREQRDLMVIVKKGSERCRKYDAVLYKSHGRYVLHRVVRVREKDYVIVGDNCRVLEYGITDDDILGILTSVVRAGKHEVKMDSPIAKIYAHIWVDLFPIRVVIIRCREIAHGFLRVLKRVLIKK